MSSSSSKKTLTSAQRRLIEENVGLVHYLVKRFCARRFPQRVPGGDVFMDELASVGRHALCRAAMHFDPKRAGAASFSTYACLSIWRAMTDDVKKRKHDEDRRLSVAAGYRAKAETVTLPPRQQHCSPLSASSRHAVLPEDKDEREAELGRRAARLLGCIDDPKDRLATSLYYLHGMTFEAVGEELGFSKERARQRVARSLTLLRGKFQSLDKV